MKVKNYDPKDYENEVPNIWGLQLPMQRVLKEADLLWKEHNKELVITSARDGIHSAGSLHYYGLAVDLRIWGFSINTKHQIVKDLQDILGDGYDVILHESHIHVEYDPKD